MRLDKILPNHFRGGLTSAERQLLYCVTSGKEADFSAPDESQNDPAQGAAWGPERTIRAASFTGCARTPRQRTVSLRRASASGERASRALWISRGQRCTTGSP
jgi:hypothetical protein